MPHNNRGISFLDEAREKHGDPSISAGVSTVGRQKPSKGTRPSLDVFRASAKFLEGSGQTQKLDRGTGVASTRPGKKKTGISTTSAVDPEATGLPTLKTSEGRILTPGVRKGLATGSAISESQRRKKGIGEFAGGGGSGFGLPTDRLPTIEELGGALGGIARFVSQLSKRNRARGLTPGFDIAKTRGGAATTGLTKAKLTTLTKLHETAILSGNEEKATEIEAQINAIFAGGVAGSFEQEQASDLEAITSS